MSWSFIGSKGERSLEAQVFSKHKEMFKASEDCLDLLKILRQYGLINETQARSISCIDVKSKRNG